MQCHNLHHADNPPFTNTKICVRHKINVRKLFNIVRHRTQKKHNNKTSFQYCSKTIFTKYHTHKKPDS